MATWLTDERFNVDAMDRHFGICEMGGFFY